MKRSRSPWVWQKGINLDWGGGGGPSVKICETFARAHMGKDAEIHQFIVPLDPPPDPPQPTPVLAFSPRPGTGYFESRTTKKQMLDNKQILLLKQSRISSMI